MLTPPLKQWLRSTEWMDHAPCLNDSRFLQSPETLGAEAAGEVRGLCAGCPVRPECARQVVENADSGVWSCGVFIPEVCLDDSDEQAGRALGDAAMVRSILEIRIPGEVEKRGDF